VNSGISPNECFGDQFAHCSSGQQMRQPPESRWSKKQQERELAELVLGYLSEHPNGMDTLQGIAEWWIPRQQVRIDVEKLARTLQELIRQGVLERIGSDSNALYRLRKKE